MYVIAGVTGNTGKVAANTLLDAGREVRVVVREAKKADAFAQRGADVAIADLSDERALAKALSGAKGAYVLLPPNPAAPDFRAYQDGLARSITSAVEASKLPHVVVLSSIGAELTSGTGPIAGLHGLESLLRRVSGTRSTLLRAGYFMENLATSLAAVPQGIFPSFLPAKLPVDMVATRDIGEVAASILAEGPTDGVVNLGGPAVTTEAIVALVEKIAGRSVELKEAPVSAVAGALQGFGFPEGLAKLYQEMLGAFVDGRIRWQEGHRRVLGKTSIETFLRDALG